MALSRDERVALLKRLEKGINNPKIPEEKRARWCRTHRLLSQLIAYRDKKDGYPYSPYRLSIH